MSLVRFTVYAEEGQAIGRGFVGVITEIRGNSIIVETRGAAVQLFIDGQTKIEAPPDDNLGFEFLLENQSARVAVLADCEVTTPDGSPASAAITAKRILLVPSKATRYHRRAITTEVSDGRLQVLDDEGRESNITVDATNLETGESLVLLMRSGGRSGAEEQVRGFIHSEVVDQRLERLASDRGNDPLELARLAELKQRRESANQQRFQKTAGVANAAHRDMLQSRADQIKEASGRLEATVIPISECAQALLGRKVGLFSELTEQQQGDLGTNCLGAYLPPKVQITFPTEGATLVPGTPLTITAIADDNEGVATVIFSIDGVSQPALTSGPYSVDVTVPSQASSMVIEATAFDEDGNQSSAAVAAEVRDTPPTVRITAPLGPAGDDATVVEGRGVTISADANDDGAVATVVFTVNGEEQASVTAPPYSVQFTVPVTAEGADPGPLSITAVAIDNAGNTGSDSVSVNVTRPTAPAPRITQPAADAKITEGDLLVIKVETDDDSVVTSVTFTIDGVTVAPVLEPPFTHSYVVPGFAATNSTADSSVPPHVFVGTASINGEPAPDGAVVIAYVASSRNSSLVVRATATNSAGQTGTASLSVPVSDSRIKAGLGTVSGSKFLVNAAQPDGASYGGSEVTFTVDSADASQLGVWRQGGANILELTVFN